MREILFRGLTKTKIWIEGFLFQTECDGVKDWCISMSPLSANDYSEILGDYGEVIPETVGQYTGLTDKNGKGIFEGDIVELTDVNNDIKWNAIVVFGNPYGEYCWGWNLMYVGANPKVNTDILCWVDMEDSGAFIEVIGNIYDNPELLKRSDIQ